MSTAQMKPRRAHSLMIVKFTGPTGMDSSKPLTKPVSAAIKMAVCSGMIFSVLRPVRPRLHLQFPGAWRARCSGAQIRKSNTP